MPGQSHSSFRMKTYRQLLEFCSHHIGQHLLPLDWTSESPARLVSNDALYLELARDVVKSIYADNGCKRFDSPVTLEACLDSVGRHRGRLLGARSPDILMVAMLDRLGELVLECLSEPNVVPTLTRFEEPASSDSRSSVKKSGLILT